MKAPVGERRKKNISFISLSKDTIHFILIRERLCYSFLSNNRKFMRELLLQLVPRERAMERARQTCYLHSLHQVYYFCNAIAGQLEASTCVESNKFVLPSLKLLEDSACENSTGINYWNSTGQVHLIRRSHLSPPRLPISANTCLFALEKWIIRMTTFDVCSGLTSISSSFLLSLSLSSLSSAPTHTPVRE